MMTTPRPDAAATLRDAGLRVTRPRVAVLDELWQRPHTDAEAISAAVRTRLGKVSKQAIYDVLYALNGAGIVRRIEPAGSPALFELHRGDNHHHLVCRGCRAVIDVECSVGQAPCLDPAQTHGFAVDEAEVVFWGLCPACSAAATPAPITPGVTDPTPPACPK
ncbi:Fur family ferric uptake transcriptional regulator [Kineosphaera limosa]|uniref:Putative Fur family transcriptional regulator n=1 Tax=Kineosphaera limosa NBRC 100340 TaxID=1184609 RepID=K6WQI0_9MICO|nr:Fur family transcriptional regulator [Kineosphaera limosa]NYE02916.1 Fur family ferric uptake transcriptional regulator [Kineosphaera limosa]GAB94347.1 putative Fur family transcriptional regulator [Kineosphaera limosa NBRC 100340]